MKKKNKLLIIFIVGLIMIIGIITWQKDTYNEEIQVEDGIEKNDVIVIPKNDEINSINEDAEITLEKAQDIVLDSIEDADIFNSEYRSSSGKSYYIITVNKDGNDILVYVDSTTGEILYQVEN